MSGDKKEILTQRLTKDQKDKIIILAINKNMTLSQLCLVAMMKYVSEEEMKLMKDDLKSEEDWKA